MEIELEELVDTASAMLADGLRAGGMDEENVKRLAAMLAEALWNRLRA